MLNKRKNWIGEKINAYFLFIALAFGISTYLLLIDVSRNYSAKLNVLVAPKNVKTAIYLDKIKESIPVIAQKNGLLEENVILKTNQETNLIEIQATSHNATAADDLAEVSARALLSLTSQYYDIKKDLRLEIVSRESQTKNYSYGLILIISIVVGLVLSFLVQLFLDLVEKIILFSVSRKKTYTKQKVQAKKELDNFFKINREKIQKLSVPFSFADRAQKDTKFKSAFSKYDFSTKAKDEGFVQQSQARFKKAASPVNLPIAQEDLNKIVQLESTQLSQDYIQTVPEQSNPDELVTIYPEVEIVPELKKDSLSADKLKEALGEPTEEEFKKRLNQLLGNK